MLEKFMLALLACSAVSCTPKQGGMTRSPTTIVARIDGQAITQAEVDDTVKGGLIRADVEYKEKVHELRSDALDKIIDDRLVAHAAKGAGVTPDALLAREVDAKIAEPTDPELHGVYEQAKKGQDDLPPFDDIRDQVVKFVKQKKREEALEAYHTKLRAAAKLEMLMPPPDLPRVPVEAVGATLGPAGAPVTIVAFSDYECPFCKRADPAMKEVARSYGNKVRIVMREFPLPMHRHAEKASEAALCAGDQGKYWEMHDKLFENQHALDVDDLKTYAKNLGLDAAKFDGCLDGNQKEKEISAAIKAGEDAGVSGTPAFFINGRPLFGAMPVERFKEIIDRELK